MRSRLIWPGTVPGTFTEPFAFTTDHSELVTLKARDEPMRTKHEREAAILPFSRHTRLLRLVGHVASCCYGSFDAGIPSNFCSALCHG